MNRSARIAFMVLFAVVMTALTVSAGETPFGNQTVNISNSVSTGASGPHLPPVVEGRPEIATVDVETSLNIRNTPWGDISGNLKKGDQVTIVGQLGDWYKITVNGKTAYVHSAYIKRNGEGEKAFPRNGWVNSSIGLNVRRVPHGDIVGVLKDQYPLEILGVTGDYYKIRWGDNNEAFVARRYIDTDMPASPSDGVERENFVGYVTASALNVRRAPWGAIDGTIPGGASVKVTGKIDDWYRIEYNGKIRYVHANFISRNAPSDAGSPPPATGTPAPSGSLQQRIAASARALIGSTAFRTADVGHGNLACAKVVTTALRNAGALTRIHLNVRSTVADLRSKGWREVTVPPFAEGDVITWKTYDYTGDGIKDPDTHVGIMVKEGNTFKAMNNSSRLRTPRLSDPYAVGPITRVLRKVA